MPRIPHGPSLQAAVSEALAGATGLTFIRAELTEFSRIHDLMGPEIAERVMLEAERRLLDAVDTPITAARVGLNGFAALATGDRQDLAAAIDSALSGAYDVAGQRLWLRAGLGVATTREEARDAPGLMRCAAEALRRARTVGGGVECQDRDDDDVLADLALAARLTTALENDRFALHYQPIVEVGGTQVRGVEALVRFHAADGTLVPPLAFIPAAERSGVIDQIGDWVLETMCVQACAWERENLYPNFGINVSPVQLRRPGFAAAFADRVARHGVDPRRIVVEVTESAWATDRVMTELGDLQRLGFPLAVDDFGVGHSSLSRLREMHAQVIKVDRSFLRDVPDDPRATGMFVAILRLAEAADCDVVVEGVETAGQEACLIGAGARLAQGFHYARPGGPEPAARQMRLHMRRDRRRPART